MKTIRMGFLLALAIVSTGCYHAMVTTGLTPSATVVDQGFASSWVYGLVPPKTVEAAAACPDGVAIVETELSFVNQLVGFLTLGIYTPMHIKVTCAAPGMGSVIVPDVELPVGTDLVLGFGSAADRAADTGEAVYVRVTPRG
jgi:hypothetical protein